MGNIRQFWTINNDNSGAFRVPWRHLFHAGQQGQHAVHGFYPSEHQRIDLCCSVPAWSAEEISLSYEKGSQFTLADDKDVRYCSLTSCSRHKRCHDITCWTLAMSEISCEPLLLAKSCSAWSKMTDCDIWSQRMKFSADAETSYADQCLFGFECWSKTEINQMFRNNPPPDRS